MYLLMLIHGIGERIRSLTDLPSHLSGQNPFQVLRGSQAGTLFDDFLGWQEGGKACSIHAPLTLFTRVSEDQILFCLFSKYPRVILNFCI